jgi:hypothetical protein
MKRAVFLIMLLCLGLTVNVATAAPPNQDEGQVYVVKAGDWLSKIALAYIGDVTAYPAIVEATNARAAEDDSFAVIEDPDLIEVGQKLWIPVGASELTLNALRNATYQGIYDEPVQLVEGGYEGEPFVPDSASRPIVTFVDAEGYYAFGDLNGDGARDAAVILAENSGGSGVFIYLAAVVSQDGTPSNVATQFLGDRVQLQSLEIDQGQIVVTMVTQGPDDPMCCPSVEVTLRYRLEDDQLVEQAGE